jgi:hypothetical protein
MTKPLDKIIGKEGSLVAYDEIQEQQEFILNPEPVVKELPPYKPTENIQVMLAGAATEKHAGLMEQAVVRWLRHAGFIEGKTVVIGAERLAFHGQWIYKKEADGNNKLRYFSWDGKPVVMAVYN